MQAHPDGRRGGRRRSQPVQRVRGHCDGLCCGLSDEAALRETLSPNAPGIAAGLGLRQRRCSPPPARACRRRHCRRAALEPPCCVSASCGRFCVTWEALRPADRRQPACGSRTARASLLEYLFLVVRGAAPVHFRRARSVHEPWQRAHAARRQGLVAAPACARVWLRAGACACGAKAAHSRRRQSRAVSAPSPRRAVAARAVAHLPCRHALRWETTTSLPMATWKRMS